MCALRAQIPYTCSVLAFSGVRWALSWKYLSINANTVDLLENNVSLIDWYCLSMNLNIFSYARPAPAPEAMDEDCVWCPMVALGREGVYYERGTPAELFSSVGWALQGQRLLHSSRMNLFQFI